MSTIIALDQPKLWTIVNDAVMGGLSQSEVLNAHDQMIFRGTVLPDNNGGFASVRANIPLGSLVGLTAIELRVRGDGKRYQLRLRMGQAFDGIAYKHEFDAPADWTDLSLPIAGFQATFRGRDIPDAEPLNPAAIGQIGFLIAGKQFGSFSLTISRIARDRRSQ